MNGLPVVIRRDHHGEPYEDPPCHVQDRMHKDRESAIRTLPRGTLVWRPYMTANPTGFTCTLHYAREEGIRFAIIRAGEPEPPDAEIILIQRS